MTEFILPISNLVQITCWNDEELITLTGMCVKSNLDSWRRFGNSVIMESEVHQYILLNDELELFSIIGSYNISDDEEENEDEF